MKRIGLLILMTVLLIGPVLAQTSTDKLQDSSQSIEIDVNGGFVVAGNVNVFNQYPTGEGGGLSAYFSLNKNFALGVMGGYYTFSQSASIYETETLPLFFGTTTENIATGQTTKSLEVMLAAKYHFDSKGIKPFIFAGVGISDWMVSESEVATETDYAPTTVTIAIPNQINPMFAVGMGLDFPIGDIVNFFIQGKESVVLVPSTGTTYTTLNSVETETVGGAMTYTAFEGGLSFDM
jgi:hypothetical protein